MTDSPVPPGRLEQLLWQPLRLRGMAAVALTLVASATAYCVLHERISGGSVAAWVSVGWAALTVLPWYLAFEAVKRLPRRAHRFWPTMGAALAMLLLALWVSVLLERALSVALHGELASTLVQHLFRRVPLGGLAALAAALLLLRRPVPVHRAAVAAASGERSGTASHAAAPTPLGACDLAQTGWITAAGNYVALNTGARTKLLRMSLREVEAALASAGGWLRVHRGAIVNLAWVESCERADGRVVALWLRAGGRVAVGRSYVPRLTAALAAVLEAVPPADAPPSAPATGPKMPDSG